MGQADPYPRHSFWCDFSFYVFCNIFSLYIYVYIYVYITPTNTTTTKNPNKQNKSKLKTETKPTKNPKPKPSLCYYSNLSPFQQDPKESHHE